MLLLPYHLRLAFRSLRRDPGLSATIAATVVPALSAARVPPSVASRSL